MDCRMEVRRGGMGGPLNVLFLQRGMYERTNIFFSFFFLVVFLARTTMNSALQQQQQQQ